MIPANDYLQEVRKFASSQYWYSGLRITAGVMVPLIVLAKTGNVAAGIPFLWGSLFVSLTDTPGPIHHRRNGMFVATLLNTVLVLLTGFTRNFEFLLFLQVIVAGFVLTMSGVYGARASAIGSLALVVSLLTLLSFREGADALTDGLMIAGGGLWYTFFSLWLYRLRPYRPVEQALGENIIAMADYLRARASLYGETDLTLAFARVMKEQSRVQRLEQQSKELLFKTRTFVSDPSPRSRRMMMMYLDSLDLYEQFLHSYLDYGELRRTLAPSGLLTRVYGLIHQLAASLEYVGLAVQMGRSIKNDVDLNRQLGDVREELSQARVGRDDPHSLDVVGKVLDNVQDIVNGINKLVLYTRAEADHSAFKKGIERAGRKALGQAVTVELFLKNLTFTSNTFRHALRLTVALAAGYGVAILFSITHPYWLLLTIVTIIRPVYSISRKRNIARLSGTLMGVLIAFMILHYVHEPTPLLVIMILSMLMGYSLLRIHYFGFVVFLTVFIVITFHFLNPVEFNTMIQERIIDTVIGSVIAFFASRFVFPSWEHEAIHASMVRMIEANQRYFSAAWKALRSGIVPDADYQHARQEAVVALTNLSDTFQAMLAEPHQSEASPSIHQFVITNHMLTGHIAGLSSASVEHEEVGDAERMAKAIEGRLARSRIQLDGQRDVELVNPDVAGPMAHHTLNQLSMIYALSRELVRITSHPQSRGSQVAHM